MSMNDCVRNSQGEEKIKKERKKERKPDYQKSRKKSGLFIFYGR